MAIQLEVIIFMIINLVYKPRISNIKIDDINYINNLLSLMINLNMEIDKQTNSSKYNNMNKIKSKSTLHELLQGTDIVIMKYKQPKSSFKTRSQSVRVMKRPQTVTGLNDLGAKEMVLTQTNNFKTVQKKFEDHNEIRSKKHKLKQCIGKIRVIKQNPDMTTSSPLQLVMEFLECLSNTDNFYTQIFEYVTRIIKSECLFRKSQFDIISLNQIIDSTKNIDIIRIANSNSHSLNTYKQLSSCLVTQFSKDIRMHNQQKQNYEQYISDLTRTVQQKRKTIIKMKDAIKYYSDNPSENLFPVVEQLETKVNVLNSELELAYKMNNQFLTNIESLKRSNNILLQKIDDFKQKILALELDKLNVSSLEQIRQNNELNQFQKNIKSLKHMLDASIIRMNGMKDEFNRVQQYNQQLVNQRSQLAKRAAIGFSELTPRPNLKQIFEDEGLNFQKVFKANEEKQKRINTADFVKIIVNRFKNVFENMKQMELNKKITLDMKGKPLNKFKRSLKPQHILQQLADTKQKARQTERSSLALKKKFNLLIQERNKQIQK